MTKTVVIVDDDQDDQEIIVTAIKNVDTAFKCISILYPKEALDILCVERKIAPDYVFLDMNMPILDGFDLLKEIRKQKSLDNMVVSVYSSSMPKEISEKLLCLGADYAFEKPISFQQYQSVIKQIVDNTEKP